MTWGTHCVNCGQVDCGWAHGRECERNNANPAATMLGRALKNARHDLAMWQGAAIVGLILIALTLWVGFHK